ncbi:hypothetical protein FIBSPDRAFT_987389 [Athelia psychrophila]|uniref:Uncharacterized protein n=1 Tax=Athelia psychrophila TaxID=1759441 RepID=A0A165Y304_9AGAM|nr:hypothetical protein FIBSPDRAFT_993848 [Fibularhizoctonia sp. CBS 109695]KZP11648.1 hypothetical protein FIBSPDRAFT_987389 [Fibularhizoctonia sp. CBS 109695]
MGSSPQRDLNSCLCGRGSGRLTHPTWRGARRPDPRHGVGGPALSRLGRVRAKVHMCVGTVLELGSPSAHAADPALQQARLAADFGFGCAAGTGERTAIVWLRAARGKTLSYDKSPCGYGAHCSLRTGGRCLSRRKLLRMGSVLRNCNHIAKLMIRVGPVDMQICGYAGISKRRLQEVYDSGTCRKTRCRTLPGERGFRRVA